MGICSVLSSLGLTWAWEHLLMARKIMEKMKSTRVHYSDQNSTHPNFPGSAQALLGLPSQGHPQGPDDLLLQLQRRGDKANSCPGSCLLDGTSPPNNIAMLCGCEKGSQQEELLMPGNPRAP